MSYLENLAKSKFNGDVKAAKEWMRANSSRGGKSGPKHFKDSEAARKAAYLSHEARRKNKTKDGMEYEETGTDTTGAM